MNLNIKQLESLKHYIDSHLDTKLTLATLSKVSGISSFHLHRLMTCYLSMPVAQYIKLKRLEKAAYQLSFRPQLDVTQIALEAGFDYLESFSRAFKLAFNLSPRDYRKQIKEKPNLTALDKLNDVANIEASTMDFQVELVTLPPVLVATYRHRGSPANLMESVGKL